MYLLKNLFFGVFPNVGRKFDLRVYVLVTTVSIFTAFVFKIYIRYNMVNIAEQ